MRSRPFLVVAARRGEAGFPDVRLPQHRYAATEALKQAFRPYAANATMQIALNVRENDAPHATVRLASREAEDCAAAALDGCKAALLFKGLVDGDCELRVRRSRHTVAAPQCPACGERFAAEDLLDLKADVCDKRGGSGAVWKRGERQFVLATARRKDDRQRAARAALLAARAW